MNANSEKKKTAKKIILYLSVAIIFLAAAAQVYQPDFQNPQTEPEVSLMNSDKLPDQVKAVLSNSCSDCHSNETKYPWYSKISPISWYMNSHIIEGRQALNLSIWESYSKQRKSRKLTEICEQVESKEMPLSSYSLIHRDAALTDQQIKLICEWTNAEILRLESETK
jgi:uncharacterized membrane protein